MGERAFLGLCGAVFLAFGVAMLLQPVEMLADFGVAVSGRHGLFEMRGVYGGVSLGIGALCLAALFRSGLRKGALLTLLAYCGGYIVARGVAFALDGEPEPIFYVFIGWEAFVALLSAALLGGQRYVE